MKSSTDAGRPTALPARGYAPRMRRPLGVFLLVVFLVAACATSPVPPPGATATPPPSVAVTPEATAAPPLPTGTPAPTPLPCIASGTQAQINARLVRPNAEAVLCQGAVFDLLGPVVFRFSGQKVYTEGHPTGASRAVLRIGSPTLDHAVTMLDMDHAELTNVIVDGDRPGLGPMSGDGLILAGGMATGQVIAHNKIGNTRTWSSVHLFEGSGTTPCVDALVEDNDIGPAGTSDNWADGISLACTRSTVKGNRITDATDGAIVVFGAPGSQIVGNFITARTRTLLGGINLVDVGPYAGDYTGTVVRENTINAAGAVIRIGLAMGERVWGCLPADSTHAVAHGATVTGNTLRGTHMQYGYAVSGVKDWTVTGNVDLARHRGTPSVPCGATVASAPAGFLLQRATSHGTFQREFANARLDLALWAIVDPLPGH